MTQESITIPPADYAKYDIEPLTDTDFIKIFTKDYQEFIAIRGRALLGTVELVYRGDVAGMMREIGKMVSDKNNGKL
jgi:hypothetical protein